MTAYVPAVDRNGEEIWLAEGGNVRWRHPGSADESAPDGWRRLYVREEPADGYCVCPVCSRPDSHAHRPVTP